MYNLSDTRVIETRNEQDEVFVVIRDTVSGKFIEIPANRWASLLLLLVDIDNAVNQLKEKKDYVKYIAHIGGGWYVSVTTGFWCVDIRRSTTPKTAKLNHRCDCRNGTPSKTSCRY